MAGFGGRRRILALLTVLAVVGIGWLAIHFQEEVLICDTTTSGIRVELHRNPLLRRASAVVLVELGSDVLPGVLPRYEIKTKEQAEMFGMALASPSAPAIDIFSRTFREQHCAHKQF